MSKNNEMQLRNELEKQKEENEKKIGELSAESKESKEQNKDLVEELTKIQNKSIGLQEEKSGLER